MRGNISYYRHFIAETSHFLGSDKCLCETCCAIVHMRRKGSLVSKIHPSFCIDSWYVSKRTAIFSYWFKIVLSVWCKRFFLICWIWVYCS